ncbi:MAG: DUF4301 family protein [Deltaproteobacteria bacterium]|nr:DUF4301 family protein [Deltaproteobacteria bacterium]
MSDVVFTEADIEQIKTEGLSVNQALAQINLFKRGTRPVKLNRPCITYDGIVTIPKEDIKIITALYEEEARKGRMLKFVPASGAASRMFKEWFRCLENGVFDSEEGKRFVSELKTFAFYNDLGEAISRAGENIENMIKNKRFIDILAYIITSRGLNYGNLPKALLKFHVYPDRNRTALEEHLVEASLHTKGSNRICRVHFSVSEEHQKQVNDYLSRIKKYFEKYYNVQYDITLSTQKSSTNTIAVDLENRPFRDQQGGLVFRPGGHGALLEDLNSIDGDIIFLKNIDNVVPDRLKPVTIFYKKVLGGYLISLQNEIFRYLRMLGKKEPDKDRMAELILFCEQKLHIVFPPRFNDLPLPEKYALIFKKLNRPIRVCGMVKNEGEPGGGPFWINEEDGTQSLQIIEESQIDSRSKEQKALWSSATHFNPVDLVCGVRDYQSQKFDLRAFVDKNSYFISQKSEKGQDIRALELPGLWNGSMAFWNTIFVEVPIETFNPVKTIHDLLRPQHLADL